jgi:sugar/nucleoside kinase (ribokinase family)
MVGRVGADSFGKELLKSLQASGVRNKRLILLLLGMHSMVV